MGSEELKPCPFCGGKAEWEYTGDYVYIQCEDCLCSTHECIDPIATRKVWNNRPHENKIKAEVIKEFADYVQNRADAWWLDDMADDFIEELERGEL